MNRPVQLLVIDDSSEAHEVIELLFGASQVSHAWNGKEGLERLVSRPDVDAVILDLIMPTMGGFEVLERLKANRRFQQIPVCVFTANREDATKALALGARDFIDKRADYQELKLRILNLVESKRRAEAASRAKTDFLAVVSHELLTPMNGILGMAQAIRDEALTSDQSRYLDILEDSSRRMMGLVDDVLRFLESENPLHQLVQTAFSPRRIVQSALERLAGEAEKNTVVTETVWGSDLPDQLTGLPDKVGLVLYHLIGNAIKFSPGGKVVVQVASQDCGDGRIRLDFSIRDTGVGFPKGWQSGIFDPFTQGDGADTRQFGGLGLGLSIASRMVQMLGGTLDVESEAGHGSLVRFSLTFAR